MSSQTAKCFCCEAEFPFGPHVYLGRHLSGYDITVCNICYDANWDGWAPFYGERISARLHLRGIEPPERNASGLLPRDWP